MCGAGQAVEHGRGQLDAGGLQWPLPVSKGRRGKGNVETATGDSHRLETRRRAPHGVPTTQAALAGRWDHGKSPTQPATMAHSSRAMQSMLRQHPSSKSSWQPDGVRPVLVLHVRSEARRQQVPSWGRAIQGLQRVPRRDAMQPHAVMVGWATPAAAGSPPQGGQEGVGPYVRGAGQGVQDLHVQLALGGGGLCREAWRIWLPSVGGLLQDVMGLADLGCRTCTALQQAMGPRV